jgi:glycosyltransferase involved in cell wall biosynthesis
VNVTFRGFRLSVTIVTRNRPDSLARALRSIRDQTSNQPFEILVGDDSTSEYVEPNQRVAEQFGARYVASPRRGLAANRNHLAKSACGTHIRTMDDDHEFIDRHLEECAEAIETDPRAIWVIGERSGDPSNPTITRPGQLNAYGCSEPPTDLDNCWSLADGATIYPREVFDRTSGLAEMFPYGHAYLEFGSRLYWLGYRVRHLLITHIVHHDEDSTRRKDSVWLGDPTQIAASRLFASLTHSFAYQPSWRNVSRALLVCAKELIRRPSGSSLRFGVRSFFRHRREVLTRCAPLSRLWP